MRRLAVPLALLRSRRDAAGTTRRPAGAGHRGRRRRRHGRGARVPFDPDRVVVAAAGTLTIQLRNDGDLAHNIRVRRDGNEIGGTQSFPPGRTESARVRLEPGSTS